MNRKEVITWLENLADDVADTEVRDELYKKIEDVFDLIYDIEDTVEKEVDAQDSVPSPSEMWDEYETNRKGLVL